MAWLLSAPASLAQQPASDDAAQQAFNNSCRTCHSVKEGDNRLGPNLNKIVGRKDFPFHLQTEAFNSGQRQDNSAPVRVFPQLPQTGRDVAAQINDVQIGPNPAELALTSGFAIPTGGAVTVATGAQFNIGSLSNASFAAIGTLNLNGGTFRVPSGSGNYYLNQLQMTGGTVDFSGEAVGGFGTMNP